MKKFLLLFMCVCSVVVMCACSNGNVADKSNPNNTVDSQMFFDSLGSINSEKIDDFGLFISPMDYMSMSRGIIVSEQLKQNCYTKQCGQYSYLITKIDGTDKYLFALYQNEDSFVVSSYYTNKFYQRELVEKYNVGSSAKSLLDALNISEKDVIDNELYIYLTDGGIYCYRFGADSKIEAADYLDSGKDFMSKLLESEDFDIRDLYC